MAFKFMKKIRSFNNRRANRKRMHRHNFERSVDTTQAQVTSDSENLVDSTKTETATENKQHASFKSSNQDEIETNATEKQSVSENNDEKTVVSTEAETTLDQHVADRDTGEKSEVESENENDISSEKHPLTPEEHFEQSPSVKQELKKASTHQDSTIIIIYQDENHNSLSSPQIISGKRGEAINFKFKEFDHYDLININGFTSVFVEPYGSITLTYRRQSGANIWLFSQDIDDLHMLGKPRFVSGKVEEKYSLTPPDFIGYNLLRAEGNVKGNFTDKQQVVTYYYRDATWKEVDFNVKYLKMKVSQPGYDAPKGNDTYVTLAEGTVWQVFESVHLTNGERWHCLGGNLWIQEDYDKVQFVDSLPQYSVASTEGYQFSINLNVQAIVDFVPGKKLTLYDRPFGNPVDSIEDGSIVTITERQGGREMQWFNLDGRGWTIRQYLDLDIEHKVAQEQGRF